MMASESPTAPRCTRDGGAYVLEMRVKAPLSLCAGRLGELTVSPGRYLYVGSAYGPGGLSARVSRHLRRHGRRHHWHIDHLTAAVGVSAVWIVPGGSECQLFSQLSAAPSARVPFAGFGSSDCRRCQAHLLAVGPELEVTCGAPLAILAPDRIPETK